LSDDLNSESTHGKCVVKLTHFSVQHPKNILTVLA